MKLAMVILQGNDTILLDAINSSEAINIPKKSGMNNFLELVGLILLLVVILIAAYYTSKFIGGIKLGQLKSSNFNIIDTYQISPNKMLQIIQVGSKYFVIAITKDNISYLTELNEQDLKLKEIQVHENHSFKQVLDKIRNKE